MLCPHCNREIPDTALFCPSCGKKLKTPPASHKKAPSKAAKKEIRRIYFKNSFGCLLTVLLLLLLPILIALTFVFPRIMAFVWVPLIVLIVLVLVFYRRNANNFDLSCDYTVNRADHEISVIIRANRTIKDLEIEIACWDENGKKLLYQLKQIGTLKKSTEITRQLKNIPDSKMPLIRRITVEVTSGSVSLF